MRLRILSPAPCCFFLTLIFCGLLAAVPAAGEALPAGQQLALVGHTESIYAIAYLPGGKQVVTGSFDKTLKLWDAATGKEIRTFAGPQGHQNLVLAVSPSPDGSTIASGSSDNTAKIWDVPKGTPLRQFPVPEAQVRVALSADGKILAGGSKNGLVKLWNTADGKELFALSGHKGAITGLAFNAAGTMLASVAADKGLRLWNPVAGKELASIGAQAGTPTGVAFNAGGNLVFTGGDDGNLKMWNVPLTPSRTLAAAHGDTVTALTLSGDNNLIFSASADKTVHVSTFANGAQARPPLQGATAALLTVATAPNSSLVAAGTADNRLLLWNLADGKLTANLPAHTGPVNTLAFHPSNSQLLTGGGDGLIKLWSLPPVPVRSLVHPDAVLAVSVVADGKRLATGGADKTVRLWNVAAPQQPERQLSGHTGPVTAVAFSPNGAVLASGSEDTTIRVWNPANGVQTELIRAHTGRIASLAFHPSGSQLVSSSADGSLKLWQVAAGGTKPSATVWQARHAGAVRQAFFSPKGDRVVSASEDKTIGIWNAVDGKSVLSIAAGESAINGIAMSADGAKLAAAGADKTLKLWALPATGQPGNPVVFRLSEPAEAVALAPNGARLAGAGASGKIHIFDTATGRELLTLEDHAGPVRSLAFLADNRTLVTAGSDKAARLLDTAVLAAVEAHAGGVSSLAFINNGTQALTGGADKTVKVWDLATAKALKTFGPLAEPVSAVTMSRDAVLVGATAGKVAKVWNFADGKEVATLTHPADVAALSFSADRTRLATAAADNLARVWDLATGQELMAFQHAGPVKTIFFHPNNVNVLAGGADKTVAIHTLGLNRNVVLGSPVRSLTVAPSGHVLAGCDDKKVRLINANGVVERSLESAEPVMALAVSKNGVLAAAGSPDGNARVFTLADGKLVSAIKTAGPVRGLAFSPNSQVLASAGAEKALEVWNVAFVAGQPTPPDFGKAAETYALAAPAADVVFGADGATLFSADSKGILDWKFAADVPIKTLTHPNLVDSVAYSPNGKILATGCHDGKLRLFDAVKGTAIKEVTAHVNAMMVAAPIYCVAWTPDGKQVVTASNDQSLKLWDATAGTLVREFKAYKAKEFEKGHHEGVFCAAFSPDGKILASAGSDRAIKLWNVADGSVLRDLVNPNLKPSASTGQAPAHPGWVYGVRFTPDGKLVSVGAALSKGYLAVWNVADGKPLFAGKLPLNPIFALALSPDGKQAAVATGNPRAESPEPVASYLLPVPGVK